MEAVGFDAQAIRTIAAVFYADDGLVATRDPKALPASFDILVSLFEQVGLATNTTKMEVMVFLPGQIRTVLSEDTYVPLQNGHPLPGVQEGGGVLRGWQAGGGAGPQDPPGLLRHPALPF